MDVLLQLVEDSDFLTLAFLIGLLAFVGRKMIESRPDLIPWGLRCAACVLILYSGYTLFHSSHYDASGLVGIFVRGLLAAGLTLGTAWIFLAAIGFFHRLGSRAFASVHFQSEKLRTASRRRQRERLERNQRAKAQAEWDRTAPERELARREAEANRQATETTQAESKRRREDARAACELFYSQHAPEIAHRFPRTMLVEFMRTYMTDAHVAADVERRGRELQQIIESHLRMIVPEEKPRTISELSIWYLDQKRHIEVLPLEEELKHEHLIALDIRYSELTQDLLQKMEP